MRSRLGGELMRAASRLAIVGVFGGMTAACSTDRFASAGALSNPFSSTPAKPAEPVRTGSINPDTSDEPMPARSTMHSRPLPSVTSSPIAPPSASSRSGASHSSQPSRARTASGTSGWSTNGGTTVVVGRGDSLSSLSSRYGVPGEAILSANGLKPGDLSSGRQIVIPVYAARQDAEPLPARGAETASRHDTPKAAAPARVVASHTMDAKKQPPRTVAEAAPPKTHSRPGQTVAKAQEPVRAATPRIVEAKPNAPAQKLAAKVEPKKPEPVKLAKSDPKKPEPVKVAKVEPKDVVLPAKKVDAKVARAEPEPKTVTAARVPVREPETTASIAPAAPVQPAAPASSGSTDFRWPARGRVISGFGGGGSNEGINIAVPEGTSVKAAGDGVVAYAGSEVKGYGNLVLIRHDNGYVSAYANNGQIDVKRGQRVNRGQAIAKSGQTGNVTSPQLHFEIRKGSTPVDPMKYLASAE